MAVMYVVLGKNSDSRTQANWELATLGFCTTPEFYRFNNFVSALVSNIATTISCLLRLATILFEGHAFQVMITTSDYGSSGLTQSSNRLAVLWFSVGKTIQSHLLVEMGRLGRSGKMMDKLQLA